MNNEDPKIIWNMWQSMTGFDDFPEEVDHNFIWYDSPSGRLFQYDFYTEIPIDENHVTRGVWRLVCHLKKPELNV
tara:strand:- start:1022 stop:1246 length:225 start_codon:yes stop_codon:yes gene_type:complete